MTPEKKKPLEIENVNPNGFNHRNPLQNSLNKGDSNCVNVVVVSPQKRIRQRKYVVVKKKKNDQSPKKTVLCKCGENSDGSKCVCEAYRNLRESQEGFFEKENFFYDDEEKKGEENEEEKAESVLDEVIEANLIIHDIGNEERKFDEEEDEGEENGVDEEKGSCSSMVKRRRERVMEEARNSVPENGKVMHLVKAFERLLSINREKEKNEDEDDKKNKVMKWALPGLQFQQPVKDDDEQSEVVSGCCDDGSLFNCTLTSEQLGLDQRVSVTSSWDCASGRSLCSRNSSGGRRSRRNSLESSSSIGGRRWKKKQKLKVTSQKPFKLRTEQRGKKKEEQLMKKVKEILTEEEKMRIPIAQGLPWTIDEPECLLKPPVKESTKPIDVKLRSDLRAIDRAEFDHQVAEKLSLIEQQKMEMERQQKLAEEEEIRRLRKELIPKAQPMPYFDRPFIPRRSMKHPTIPKEPKFHIPHHKKIKCLTLNEMRSYSSCFN